MARVKKRRLAGLVVIFLALICLGLYLRPLPLVKAQPAEPTAQPLVLEAPNLPWPAAGQAAIGANGYGLLADHNDANPVPTASVAKVMTALAVLDKYPLSPGDQGPAITITANDVAFYQSALAQGQSVIAVRVGEQISEYQALQAMLIPSANNIAYTLARWAFGSLDSYLSYANQKAKALGLVNTNFADASGFSPQTTSTVSDLVLLGLAAIKSPEIMAISGQPQASLPIVGVVKNVNVLLGNNGIIGIKTGNTDQAGGCFLLAANRAVSGQPVTTVVAILGAPNLVAALSSGKSLLGASDSSFAASNVSVQRIYKAPWGAEATVSKNISLLTWQSAVLKTTTVLKDLPAGSAAGTKAGSISLTNAGFSKNYPLYLGQKIPKPTIWWRIFH